MKSPPSEYTFICINVNEKLQFGGNNDLHNAKSVLKYPLGHTSLDGIHGVRRRAIKNSQMAYAVWQHAFAAQQACLFFPTSSNHPMKARTPPKFISNERSRKFKHAEPVNLKYSCRFNSGARLTFTDMYFAALTVNITTFIFVFPTTGWVVVWHVEVNSFWKCKYSSWAFMLSCQTSSQ